METYQIFKKTLAYKLIAAGNILLDKEKNVKNDKYYTYIFENTEKFRNDLTNITSK